MACIPAFNEEKEIAKVVIGAERNAGDVLVCDDGSSDMTGIIAQKLGAEVIRHERNMGYGASIASLIGAALQRGADVVVTLDGDGQHDPGDIPRVVKPIVDGVADIVVGSRFEGDENAMPGYRSAGVKLITGISNSVGGAEVRDAQSGFRAYSAKAAKDVIPVEMGMGASTEILSRAARAGLRVAHVGVTVSYPKESSSQNPVAHGVEVVFTTFKHVSIRHPLVIYGIPGFGFLVFGLVLAYKDIQVYSATDRVFAGSTLVAATLILIGLILLAVAVMLWVMISLLRDPEYRGPASSVRLQKLAWAA